MYDMLIVGCGLSGGVIARYFAEHLNKAVCIIDRRNHIAGNMFDYVDENNFLIQQYGPHTFHTNNADLYNYICKFADWVPYKLTCMAKIDGKFTPTPFNFQTIDDFFSKEQAEKMKKELLSIYPSGVTTIVDMLQSSNKIVRDYAEFLFQNDYGPYTAKQWGISPEEIDISVLKRVPVLFSYKTGYFDDTYQVMPKISFTDFFKTLLNHPNITVRLNTEAGTLFHIQKDRIVFQNHHFENNCIVVYTGAPDELLQYQYGYLPYRSLDFQYETIYVDSFQDAPVVAYPKEPGFTRITEYTKIPYQKTNGKTVIAKEYPTPYEPQHTEPYYPILTQENQSLYQQYKLQLSRIQNLFLCGRLADYKYYNMDQALENALSVCNHIASFL